MQNVIGRTLRNKYGGIASKARILQERRVVNVKSLGFMKTLLLVWRVQGIQPSLAQHCEGFVGFQPCTSRTPWIVAAERGLLLPFVG